MVSSYLGSLQVQEIISVVLASVLPNLLVIVTSSFLGAFCILKGQTIQKRRNRLSAFYAECLDNADELSYLVEDYDKSNPLKVHSNSNIQSTALKNLQKDTPKLYSNLFGYSDAFKQLILDLDSLENLKKLSFWENLLSSIKLENTFVPDGGEPVNETEDTPFDIERVDDVNKQTIRDIQDFVESSRLRKIYYRNCLHGYLKEDESEEEPDSG